MKLAGNVLVTAAVETLAEASALVARAGVDQTALHAVVTDALFPGRPHEKFGAMIAADRCPADARFSLGAKDNRLLLDAARDLEVALPVAELVRERFRAAAQHAPAGVEEDWSSIARRSFAEGAA